MKEIKRQARVHWAGVVFAAAAGKPPRKARLWMARCFQHHRDLNKAIATNPEELIAAAQASCFSMMLAKILSDQKQSVEQIDTNATVVMRQENGHPKISEIHLRTEAKVIGMDANAFQKAAEEAKENCPVSVLLKPGLEKITLEATLA